MKAHEIVPLILKAFPETKSPPAPGTVKTTIYKLAYERFDMNQDEAAAWLLTRVEAWAKSSLCRSTEIKYRLSMVRWLTEEQYDSPDECWMTKVERSELARKERMAKEREAERERMAQIETERSARRLRLADGDARAG